MPSERERLIEAIKLMGFGDLLFTPQSPLADCDAALATNCYQAFAVLISDTNSLIDTWTDWQTRIADYKARVRPLPRDLYLALLLTAESPPFSLEDIDRVSKDPLICRKIIAPVTRESYRAAIETWPFLTFAGSSGSTPTALVSVLDGFKSAGYNPEVIDTFSKWISAEHARSLLRHAEPSTHLPESKLRPQVRRVIPPEESPHRLGVLRIKDFRGIRKLDVDLSADLVLVHGRNGTGKTSLFDSLEWALLGEIEHLVETITEGDERPPYINLFSDDGVARVSLELQTNNGPVTLVRSINLSGQDVLEYQGKNFSDDRSALIEILGEQARNLNITSLRDLVRSSNFLAQATLRRFFSKKPAERYAAVSYLLGTHDYSKFLNKLNDVAQQFEKEAKKASQESAALKQEIAAKRANLQALQSQMVNSPAGLELDARLQETLTAVTNQLSAFNSEISTIPIAKPFLFEEVDAFLDISEQWHRVTVASLEKRLRDLAFLEQSAMILEQQQQQAKDLRAELLASDARLHTLRGELQEEEALRRKSDDDNVRLRGELRAATEASLAIRRVRDFAEREAGLSSLLASRVEQATGLRQKEDLARRQRDEAQESINLLLAKRGQLQKEVERDQGLLQLLYTLQARVADLEKYRIEAQELQSAISKEENGIASAQEKLKEADQRQAEIFSKLDSAVKSLDSLRKGLEQYRGLLSALQEFIRGEACPLCGQRYESAEELRRHVRDTIEADPPELQRLDGEVQTLRQRLKLTVGSQDQLRAEIAASAATIRSARTRLTQLDSNVAEIRQLCTQTGFAELEPNRTLIDEKQRGTEDVLRQRSTELAELESEWAAKSGEVSQLDSQLRFTSEQRVQAEREVQSIQQELSSATSSRAALMQSLSLVDLAKTDEVSQQISDRIKTATDQAGIAERDRAVREGRIRNIQAELESLSNQKFAKEEQLRNLSLESERLKATASQIDNIMLTKFKDEKRDIESSINRLLNVSSAISKGKQLASWLLARRQAQATTDEIERLTSQKKQVDDSGALDKRWGRHLKELSQAITNARHEAENWQLENYGPSISNLYKRFSAHPIFGDITASVDPAKEEVRITADVSEFLLKYMKYPVGALAPLRYFSEAQGNVLALSVFLSNAFQQRWSRINTVFMDDPVQNMDDLNANAFIDTLRALTGNTGRQFVVATCDLHLYKLMLVKLACLNSGNGTKRKRFSAYRLEGISVNGPELITDL